MSISTVLYLPPETRLSEVVMVASILLGAEVTETPLTDSYCAEVSEGLQARSSHAAVEMAIVEGMGCFWGTYHFEASRNPLKGPILMTAYNPNRRPFWEAMANFFGGLVDLNDCDDIDFDIGIHVVDQAYRLNPEDGAGWKALQDAILAVRPVMTPEEWRRG